MKRQPTQWEKIFISHLSVTRDLYTEYIKSLQFNNKDKQLNLKTGKELNKRYTNSH